MRQALRISLPFAMLFLLVIGAAPQAAKAKGPSWSELAKAFRKNFKGDKSIRERTLAVLKISKSEDYRGIDVLLKAYKGQLKNTEKMYKSWEVAEAEWQEKDKRIRKQLDAIAERAKRKAEKKGGTWDGKITAPKSLIEWVGNKEIKAKGAIEKAKVGRIYTNFLEEDEFSKRVLREVARLANSLSGEDKEKGERLTIAAVRGASGKKVVHLVTLLGYMECEAATEQLIRLADTTRAVDELQATLSAMGRQNSERGKKYLLSQLAHASWTVRGAALHGLSFYKDENVVDALLAHAEKEEGVLRRRVFGAMASIVDEPVLATLDAWRSWWKANREQTIKKWSVIDHRGKPVSGEPKRYELKTTAHQGGTSFYGIKTDSKHIVFVVDVSGSMRPVQAEDGTTEPEDTSRIGVARKELLRALKGLSAVDEDERGAATFNIVTFSTDVNVFKPKAMVVATKKNKERAFKWIEKHVKPQEQTDIYGGIHKAFNIFSAHKEKKNMAKGADTIFLMTDGAPTLGKFTDPKLILAEVQRMNKVRQLSIHTIGVGKNHASGFLKRLAAENHGQYIGREK